ncbi:restriction endonuclease subunit S [Chitinophagales bacterium]|nr:restriction endonuclease subunit S [Chitinophagales bacterium]
MCFFEDNDVLLAKITPCFENGKLGIAKGLANGVGFGSSEYHVFRPEGIVLSEYIYYYLSLGQIRKEGKGRMTGAVGHRRIPKEYLSELNILIPPLPQQKQIVAILDKAFAAIDTAKSNAEQNLQNAKELFESYLQGVFEGKGDDWEEKRLDEITEVKDGTHDSPKYISDGIPFVTQKNIRDAGLTIENTKFITGVDHQKFYKRSNVTYGDILISMIGANRGMSAMVDVKDIFSIKNVGLIKESLNINQFFLLYFLQSTLAMKYIKYMSNGGAQEFIGLRALRAFPIPYPISAKEQRDIVSHLDKLSTQIKKLESIYKQKIADLEEMKKSVLQKAFSGELSMLSEP